MDFVANLIRVPAVQTFWELVKIWQSYGEFKGGNFFETQCTKTDSIFVEILMPNYTLANIVYFTKR